MSQNLNPVIPTIRFDEEEISFESLALEQSMNSCHRFDVVKVFMSQDEMWKETPEKLFSYIGSKVLICFKHKYSDASYQFKGWVTDVRIDAWESDPDNTSFNHKYNRVHIIGEGDVLTLNSSRGNDSFVDCQLKDIVSQCVCACKTPLQCDPRFDGILPYVMRYHETAFEFLNRLSSTYNELFFYDGSTLHFGQPDKCGEETLTFEQDVFSLRTHASAKPHNITAYEYFADKDETCYANGSSYASPMLEELIKRSDRLFTDQEAMVSPSPVTDENYLKRLADAKVSSSNGAMLTVEGETRTCRITLGSIVEIAFPQKMDIPSLGRFRIISLTHKVDKSGNYSNHFKASPEGQEQITQKFLGNVQAHPQMATVVSNSDSFGRVMVQFDWQKRLGKSTNWIRVQSPDAGGSNMTNRGLVFIPEVGDQVMVGFEYGDPNRPYVMGGLFNGKTGTGGGIDNNIHSIVTKSGHQIVFNDDQNEWGITISDKNGNVIKLDTQGKNISLSANETISLTANNITIDAAQIVSINAGEDLTLNAYKGMTASANESISLLAGEDINTTAKNIAASASENERHNSDTLSLMADSEIEMNSKKIGIDSTKENLLLASGADVDAQAKGKVNLF
ncbi:MAG: phage baseplate assembly protein V [Paludibacteraceae bacterium]|nr:phage baseplate assembly protein V [Paludibacteraceae bacterium]